MALVLARSLAGHDKDEVYVILGEEEGLALLVNGKNRTLDKPKKKKYKHLQVIRSLPGEIEMPKSDGFTDLDVKKVLKDYQRSTGCQKLM